MSYENKTLQVLKFIYRFTTTYAVTGYCLFRFFVTGDVTLDYWWIFLMGIFLGLLADFSFFCKARLEKLNVDNYPSKNAMVSDNLKMSRHYFFKLGDGLEDKDFFDGFK
ncbi:hypothetical protein [Desulfovibrio sp. JC010]|uniref:hypothetical protein n=1 Tax=Desulfovibrio sp. JC010 TaxID=2593641 RepID=UPI0013D4B6AB|nr:hypothetical protein [Desulfovibrio sp. JC010]NDV28688.1 hypothetical protein [Desulfovibrio sp. JC010]